MPEYTRRPAIVGRFTAEEVALAARNSGMSSTSSGPTVATTSIVKTI